MNLPYTYNKNMVRYTNIHSLEEEINTNYDNLEDLILLAEVSEYSYYPIDTTIDSNGYMRIRDDIKLIGLNFFICSKRQFLHKRINIEEDTYKIVLDEYFKTAWDKSKFVIFQDGYLMNSNLFTIIIPSFSNNYLKKIIYSTAKFRKDSRIDIYYIESNEDFSLVSTSRDIYLGSIRYTAITNNDRVIPVPYPKSYYKRDSFFVFNEDGYYLDERIDYVVSNDGKYISLSEENALKLANVDYLIFAFPYLAKDTDLIEYIEDNPYQLEGSPIFTYAYSTPTNDNESGLIRFVPPFTDYHLSKKNFLLFGNGEWIHPSRFDIHNNDSILFISEEDRINSVGINYTMIIFDNSTNHDNLNLPSNYMMLEMIGRDESVFRIETVIPNYYKSCILIKDNYIIDPNTYTFDDEQLKITFNEPINGIFYIILISSLVNNTKQDAVVETFSFPCNRYGTLGTPIPDTYKGQMWNKNFLLLFLNGAFLEPSLYTIENDTIRLDRSFYMDDMGNPISLEGYTFTAIYLIGLYNSKQLAWTDEEIDKFNEEQSILDDQYTYGIYLQRRISERNQPHGVITFKDNFTDYKLTKRHFILFSNGGQWIDPLRFEIVNNNKLYFNYPFDHKRSIYTNYNMIVLNDLSKDDKWNPPNFKIEYVMSTKDDQYLFDIPKVDSRFETFLLFKGGVLLSFDYRYQVSNNQVRLLHEQDFLSKGRNLVFIFLDAFTRLGQENRIIQGNFRKDSEKSTTTIPSNFLDLRSNENIDHIMLFINGLYLSPDKYKIIDGELYLDGYLPLEEFEDHIFTIVYITTLPCYFKTYDNLIPKKPDLPVSTNLYTLGNAYWTKVYSNQTIGKIIKFNEYFKDYYITKQNVLLFANKTWIHPSQYEVYDNDIIIVNQTQLSSYIMAIFNDVYIRDITISPLITKTIDVEIDKLEIDIPNPGKEYKSFIIFMNGRLIDLDEYDVDLYERKIYLKKIFGNQFIHYNWNFVFLHAHMNINQQSLLVQDSFIYEGEDTYIPTSIFNDNNYTPKYSLFFVDGYYLSDKEFKIKANFTITIPNIRIGAKVIVVHLISMRDDDYTQEVEIERKPVGIVDGFNFYYSYSDELPIENRIDSGIVSFHPIFRQYEINNSNMLIFANGTFIAPDRYKVRSNNTIEFLDDRDIKHSDWTHYTMLIPNDGNVDEEYTPVSLSIVKITATEEKQRMFDIPDFGNHATYLIFLGSLFVPMDVDRIYFTDDNKLVFVEEDDYVDKDRSLYFVIINDSSASDRRYPMFIQESFAGEMDPSRGTLIPSNWRDNEEHMILFMNSMYMDKSRYEIRDHKIYLYGDYSEMDNPLSTGFIKKRTYTTVYMAAKVLDEYTETTVEPVVIPPDYIEPEPIIRVLPEDDELDTKGYIFKFYKYDIIREDSIEILEPFTTYTLDNNNFILFSTNEWINNDRLHMINNGAMNVDTIDSEFYYMIFPFSNEAYNEYKDTYIKTDFKVVEIITSLQQTDELKLPTIDFQYESFIVLRDNLILPIQDEDRYYIDDDNHKFKILNSEDHLPPNTKITFLYMNSSTNSGEKLILTQESFKCYGLDTSIPKTLMTYTDQVFNKSKIMLFLNGVYLDQSEYILHENVIYLVDEDRVINKDDIYTMIYLNVLSAEDEGLEPNLVNNITYEETIDDIIIETAYAKPHIV